MKRLFGMTVALVMCAVLAVCACAITVDFDDGAMGYASIGGHTANGKVENGVLTFDMTDADPQIYINRPYDPVKSPYGVVNADKCKQIEIRFATEITSGTLEIFFTSKNPEDGSWFCKPWEKGDTSEQSYVANSRKYKFETSGSLDDFVTLTIDRDDVPYWKGIVTSFRIDPDSGKGKKFALDYVKFPGEEPEPTPEPETPAVPVKPQWVLEEEKLYGECLLFDDFESYALESVPSTVYYSKAGSTGMAPADQCKSYKIVNGTGTNTTKVVELISKGSYKYPFISVGYKLEEPGEFIMLMDAYTEVETAQKWAFHNGFTCNPAASGDNRYRDETNVITAKRWQTPMAVHGTNEKPNLVSVDYFRFGGSNLLEDEKIYLDNIRAYFKPYIYATVNAGGAEGTVPEICFVKNSVLTLPECTLTKEGYTFDGWKNSIDSKIYKAGEKLSTGDADSLTITAVWSKFRPVTIRKNSIRTQGKQGMRFAGYITNENKADADEYGFIVTRKSLLGDNQLVFGTNTSDTSGTSPDGVKYVYGAAYNKEKGIDEVYATDGSVFGSAYWKDVEGVFFTGVLTEIGEPAYQDKLVVRAYAKVGDNYSYGDEIVRSIRDIAQNAYDDGNREEYVMNILNKTKNLPNKTVCFFGDSITQNGTYIKELFQVYLDSDKEMGRIEMYNVGIPGDTAAGGLNRIDSELMGYNPDIVAIMFGMNDISGGNYKKGEYSEEIEARRQAQLDQYEANMRAIVDKLLGYGVEVILCTPTPYDDVTDTVYERSVGLAKCAEIIKEIAKEKDLKVVDHFGNMYPICSQKYISNDFVHPNTLGHHLMAQSFMYSLGYIDEMETDVAMTKFDEDNAARHTLGYNYQMMLMVERTVTSQGYTELEAKKQRAAELQAAQTNDHWRWIYQNYIDNIGRAAEMLEEVIQATEELSYKR